MATEGFELDYEDMRATADGFESVAADLRACLLGGIPSGTGVYGYPVLANAVDQLADAFRTRHTAVSDASERVGRLRRACMAGYQRADEAAAALLEARLRILDAASKSPAGPAGLMRPV